MAAIDLGARNAPPVPADDMDLYDYDFGDVFRDVDPNMDVPLDQKAAVRANGKENDAGLGIDEEIKVVKKRVPVVKLDEKRLLSPAGIPKLRRISTSRIKFKGKGHEYSDVARLLNVYQLWLDDLYPRAKFADGLAIIEKLGHTKRMQTMRREWINESKPRDNFENPGNAIHELKAVETSTKTEQGHSPEAGSKDKSSTPVAVVTDDDELYMATPKRRPDEGTSNRNLASTESLFVTDEEPDDDLDELLNQTKDNPASYTALPEEENTSRRRQDDFEDELEAIASLNDMW